MQSRLAYYDSCRAGLVPVRVLSVTPSGVLLVRVTGAREGYERGHTFAATASHVPPRWAVTRLRSRTSHPRILPFTWEPDSPAQRAARLLLDGRYSFRREWSGHEKRKWVARFCGDAFAFCDTKEEALAAGLDHDDKRLGESRFDSKREA